MSKPPSEGRLRLILAVASATMGALSGCAEDIGELPLSWTGSGPTSSSRAAGPVSRPPRASSQRGADAAEALDCDDLPALTPDELAGPPYDIDLQKPSRREPGEPPPRYTLLSGVTLSREAASALERLDDAYFKKTGEHLIVTSGTRDAALQAKAMYKMIKLGADIVRLYKNKEAAREIKEAYDRAAGRPPEAVISAMYEALRDQIGRGVYISSHLRAGAVDIRSRTMSAAEKRAFEKSAAEVGGVRVLEESKPPHYHLELD